MKSSPLTSCCVLLTLLSIVAVCSGDLATTLDDQISHSFYFESHGRDDLREWRAAILKGAQYIKIDFNFITDPDLCSQQQQLPRSYNFSKGCFLLVHSFQNTTFWGAPAINFNTTLEIGSWLLDDRNMDVMMLRPIVFQCCFKGKPNLCDGSDNAAMWTALMDDFYNLVQPIISDPQRINNNVQFVFDQLNQADQCILLRWRPWNSTWVGEAGTGEDNNRGTNVTFQMVNMETTWANDWQWLNNTDMGKFHDGEYAMVAWEPVDEVDCNGFFKYFRTFRYVNPAGTILAYNADPSMFHVFTASETQRYSHFPYGPEKALTPVIWYSESLRKLFTVSLVSGDEAIIAVTVHQRAPRGRFVLLSTVPIMLQAGYAQALFGTQLVSLGGTSLNATSVRLMIAGRTGVVVPIVINFDDGIYSVDSAFSSMHFNVAPASETSIGFAQQSEYGLLAASATVDSVSRTLIVEVFNVSGSTPISISSPVVVANGVVADEGLNIALAADVSTSWITAIVSWSTQRAVFTSVTTGSVSLTSGVVFSEVIPSPNGTHVKVGVGRNPYLAFASVPAGNPQSVSLLLTYGWSFCYNDLLIDDDSFTMVATKICDLQDTWYTNLFENASNPVNSYVFTNLSLFVAEVAYASESKQHLNGFATTCSDTIFHGVFDVGYNASAVLLPRDDTDVDINVGGFLGLSSMTSLSWPWVSVSFCGNPVPHNGMAILDSFPLFGFYNRSAL